MALRDTTIFVSSVFTHLDLEGDNIVFARVGLDKFPSNRVSTRRASTRLWRFSTCKVSFWRWRFQATDIARRFRPNTLKYLLGSCTPLLACVSCLNDVVGSTAWCQRDIKKMSMLHHFLNFPSGRGYDRYPSVVGTLVETGPWPGPTLRVPVSPKFPADCGHLS